MSATTHGSSLASRYSATMPGQRGSGPQVRTDTWSVRQRTALDFDLSGLGVGGQVVHYASALPVQHITPCTVLHEQSSNIGVRGPHRPQQCCAPILSRCTQQISPVLQAVRQKPLSHLIHSRHIAAALQKHLAAIQFACNQEKEHRSIAEQVCVQQSLSVPSLAAYIKGVPANCSMNTKKRVV